MTVRPEKSTIASAVAAAVLSCGATLPQAWRWWQIVLAVALLAALGLTGRRVARWLVPELGALSRATAAAAFAALAAILPATLLGHFGVLRAAPFFVVVAVLALLALLLPRPQLAEAAAGPELPEAEPDAAPLAAPRPLWSDLAPALLATALFVLLFVGVRDFLRIVREPDGSYGPDGISYHMSMVATWHRTGDLRTMKFAMGDPSPAFYPLASELASWTLLAPFGDSDVLARRSQVPFTLFACLAIAALARRLGLARRHRLLAVLLYAANEHVFPWLGLSASNDPTAAFFLLAALDGSLALARRPRAGTAVYAGIGYGLLAGTKYLGILYGGAQLAVLALAWLFARGTEDGEAAPPWRRQAALLALGACVALVAGGYPYLRNAVTAGNPLFPEPIRLFGRVLFPGWGGVTLAARRTLPDFAIDTWSFLLARADLFALYFPFTLLPAALVAPLLALRRRRVLAAAALALPLVLFLVFRFLVHDHRDSRYLLPALALAAVAFAWLCERAGPRSRAALVSGASCLALVAAVEHLHLQDGWRYLLPPLLAALGVFLHRRLAGRRLRLRLHPLPAALAAAAFAVFAVVYLAGAVEAYQAGRFHKVPVARALDAAAGPQGANVAYVGLNQPYLYFGRRLQNDVEIVPTTWDDLEERWYTFGGSPVVTDDEQPLFRRWAKILDLLHIDYVVVDHSEWEDPERGWMALYTERFRLLASDARSELWQVRR